MSARADAHLHFFQPGYGATLPKNYRRVHPDEVTLYQALAQQYNVQQVLPVGYEGKSWAAGNNQYLAQLAASRPWLRPVAFVHEPNHLDTSMVESRQQERFVGLTIYLFDEQQIAAPGQVPEGVDLADTVPLAGKREFLWRNWAVWLPVLERYPELRLRASLPGVSGVWRCRRSGSETYRSTDPDLQHGTPGQLAAVRQ